MSAVVSTNGDGKAPSFVILWRNAIAESDLSPTQRLVAHTLALHMNADGGNCFPSLTRLQHESGLGRKAVWTALKALESAKYIERIYGAGVKGSTLYRPRFPQNPARCLGHLAVGAVGNTARCSGHPEYDHEGAQEYDQECDHHSVRAKALTSQRVPPDGGLADRERGSEQNPSPVSATAGPDEAVEPRSDEVQTEGYPCAFCASCFPSLEETRDHAYRDCPASPLLGPMKDAA